MKIGFVSAVLGDSSFEEMVETASKLGYQCVEVACWPNQKAERKYAGVCHIDVESLNQEKANYIKEFCKKNNVEISALAFYPNNMDGNLEKRKENNDHLLKVIVAAKLLGIGIVTTFIGRDQTKTIEENFEMFEKVWKPIIAFAEQKKVRIAIENCPMLFDKGQWPGGQNLATTPRNWRKMFEILKSEYFGLNFDPSHFVWQFMDYIKPIYEFKDKIFHIHFKDIKVYQDKLNDVGAMGYPLEFMQPKLPGLGDVDWAKFASALTDIGFDGYACVEVEDKAFESSKEKIEKSLILSMKYLEAFII